MTSENIQKHALIGINLFFVNVIINIILNTYLS